MPNARLGLASQRKVVVHESRLVGCRTVLIGRERSLIIGSGDGLEVVRSGIASVFFFASED